MANFLFYRYHFVPAEEPDLFAQEECTDASRDDDVHNPRLSADLESKASGIRKLELCEFKADKTGVQASLQQKKSAFNNPDAMARLVTEYCSRGVQSTEILLTRGARTILWVGR